MNNVAVLMATFNGERFIKSQLKSILKSESNNTIYISDDASDDNTLNIINDLQSNSINVICTKKKGSSCKNFLSLIRSFPEDDIKKYEYFAFSDQDDVVSKTHYINSINHMKKTGADLCGSSTIDIDDIGNTLKKIDYSAKQTKYCHLVEGLAPGFTFVFSKKLFILFRKKLLINKIPDIFWHDWLLYGFCVESGLKVVTKKSGDVFYRQHEKNITGSRRNLKGIKDRLEKIIGRFYLNQIIKVSVALKILTGKKNLVYRILHNDSNFTEKFNFIFNSRRRLHDRMLLSYTLINLMVNAKKFKLIFSKYFDYGKS